MAFKDLKTAVTTAPVLVSPQESDSFQIEVNSSDFATGAVLSQQSTMDGKWYLIAFYSKSLSSMKWNYKIHNKEMLAIIRALEKWRHFLEGATYPITNGHLLICDWCFRILKGSEMRSLDSDKRCC